METRRIGLLQNRTLDGTFGYLVASTHTVHSTINVEWRYIYFMHINAIIVKVKLANFRIDWP